MNSQSRETRINELVAELKQLIDQPMLPVDYIAAHLERPLHMSDKDYRKFCTRAMGLATGLFPIEWGRNWSKYPSYAPQLIRLADTVKRIQAFGVGRNENYGLYKQIELPPRQPYPRFMWGDLLTTKEGDVGRVILMGWVNECWFYELQLPNLPTGKNSLTMPEDGLSFW